MNTIASSEPPESHSLSAPLETGISSDVLTIFGSMDLVALVFFALCWISYAVITDNGLADRRSLTSLMNDARHGWMDVLKNRSLRIVDTSIIAGLQQGTAFFASTCLLAIGGCFALLGATDKVAMVYEGLPLAATFNPMEWEIKLFGLVFLFAYSFFKFGWAYRLFNYCSIVIGSVPPMETDDEETKNVAIRKAGLLNILGAKHFNAGLRGVFFSLGYLGWFIGPAYLIAGTFIVTSVLIRRQFFSAARKALVD